MPPRPATTRRTLLTAGAGVAALGVSASVTVGGCDVHPPRLEVPGRRDDDADVRAATEATRLVQAILAQLSRTTARHPQLATPLAGVLAMHRAHLGALEKAVSRSAPTPTPPAHLPVPAGRAAALRDLAKAERPVHARLLGLAQKAQSGEFARLLAAMAAAVSQRLDQWPTLRPGPGEDGR